MTRIEKLLVVLALACASRAAAAQGAPSTVSFVARLADSGTPLSGSHDLGFELFDSATGGTSKWTETRSGIQVPQDGLLYLDLGSIVPLDASIFDGTSKYLELTIDGVVASPRMLIGSVPYAIRAGVCTDSDTLQSRPASAFQLRVTGTCPAGSSIASIDALGGVLCEQDTDTTYTAAAGGGLTLAGTAFSADTAVVQARVGGTCAAGSSIRVINANGTVTCELDDNTNTTYSNGSGLNLTGTVFSVDTTTIQARVSGTCAIGSAIRSIDAAGAVTCQPTGGATTASGRVDASETRNNTAYGDLATVGPSATVTIPASGAALITLTAQIDPASGDVGFMSFSGGGIAASDTRALIRESGTSSGTGYIQASATYHVTGLNTGSQTITAKYRSTGGAVPFLNRHIIVMPLP